MLLLESFLAWKFGHHEPLNIEAQDDERDGLDSPGNWPMRWVSRPPSAGEARSAASPVRTAVAAVAAGVTVVGSWC